MANNSVVRNSARLNKHGKTIECNPQKAQPVLAGKPIPHHNRMTVTVNGLTRIWDAYGKTIFLGTNAELLGLKDTGSTLYFARTTWPEPAPVVESPEFEY